MSTTLFIRQVSESGYQWFADGAAVGQGSLDQLHSELGRWPDARLRLLLPGENVLLSQIPCGSKERRHLRKAAPYELEESLVSGVEELHFAFTKPEGEFATAACCDREWLAARLTPFEDAGLELHQMMPEPLALPYPREDADESLWTMRMVDNHVWVRYGYSQGLVLEHPLAVVALQQLQSEQGEPAQILLLADSEDEISALQELLPQTLRDRCEFRTETLPQSITANDNGMPVLDMRQGDFSNHLPVARWWWQWKNIAVLAAAVLVVFAASQWLQYNQLQQQSVQLRQQIAEAVTSGLSRTVVGDTRRQLSVLRSELRTKRGGGASDDASAIGLLSEVMPLFAGSKGLVLNTINVSAKDGEIRISCWAPSIDSFQQLKEGLEQKQFTAAYRASADGDGQQGTFNINKNRIQR